MKKTEKTTESDVAIESVPTINLTRVVQKNTRIVRAAIPYTSEMITELENGLDVLASDGFEIVACLPYGVDHMVILLKRVP